MRGVWAAVMNKTSHSLVELIFRYNGQLALSLNLSAVTRYRRGFDSKSDRLLVLTSDVGHVEGICDHLFILGTPPSDGVRFSRGCWSIRARTVSDMYVHRIQYFGNEHGAAE